MNQPTARLPPGISADGETVCWVPGCSARWGVVCHNVLSPTVQVAIFGEDFDCSVLCLCQRHYKYLRTRDGVTLGYRKVAGKLQAYVKDESF
jgi:hypothetical protein